MKKIITSAGLVALGVAGAQAQAVVADPGFGAPDPSRPWSVSASLRGFYDDNYLTAPDHAAPGQPQKRSSIGFQVTPSAGLSYSTDTTDIGARYTFGMLYYDDRRSNKEDYTHSFDLSLNHNFTERYSVFVSDSFVVSQEPTVLDPSGATSLPFRTQGNNIRNLGSLTVNATLTHLLTAVVGYSNTFYDYDAKGPGSYSALLNRMEHLILGNLRWQVTEDTVGVVGYQYGRIYYTANQFLVGPGGPKSDVRDSYSHYVYLGADHTFNPDISASAKVGAQYTDSYNMTPNYTSWNPYADVSATYRYGVGSYAELGFRQFFNQTDALAANTSSSVVYGSINHRLTSQLMGSLLGTYQYSKFNGNVLPGTPIDGQTQNYFLVGVNLSYQFARHFSADAGYNFDALRSKATDAGRYDWTRNRVYFGLTATY